MGVKDLWKILDPVKKHTPISSLKGQTIPVDLGFWVCELRSIEEMEGKVAKPHLRNLFFRVARLLQHDIKLIMVLDGDAPQVKWEEMNRRMEAKYGTYSQTSGGRSNFKVLLKECQSMLSLLGIPCVQSKGEAEAMCALLNSHGIADACLTDDSDAFLYGALTVYRNFTLDTKDPSVDAYSMDDIRNDLDLDRRKLVALGLLIGCDYHPQGVKGVGKVQAVGLMKQWGDDVNVLERFEQWASGDVDAEIEAVKSSHCRVCKHIGTMTLHRRDGCDICGTPTGSECVRDENVPCSCLWHKHKVERDIVCKAKVTAGFPFKSVIKEYLDQHEECPSDWRWDRPQLVPLQDFMRLNLDWSDERTVEKVFPLMTLYDMTNQIAGKYHQQCVVLESFVKTRIRQGVPCFEVRWENPGWDGKDSNCKYRNTIEREDLLKAAYADKYRNFMDEKEAQKSAKKSAKSGNKKKLGKGKGSTDPRKQTNLNMFFKTVKSDRNVKDVPGTCVESVEDKLQRAVELGLNGNSKRQTESAGRDSSDSDCKNITDSTLAADYGPNENNKRPTEGTGPDPKHLACDDSDNCETDIDLTLAEGLGLNANSKRLTEGTRPDSKRLACDDSDNSRTVIDLTAICDSNCEPDIDLTTTCNSNCRTVIDLT